MVGRAGNSIPGMKCHGAERCVCSPTCLYFDKSNYAGFLRNQINLANRRAHALREDAIALEAEVQGGKCLARAATFLGIDERSRVQSFRLSFHICSFILRVE